MKRDIEDERWMGKVKTTHSQLVLFLRQLSILMASGVPLVSSLDTLSHQPENPQFASAIAEMSRKIGHGFTLSVTFSKFPRLFSSIHVALVMAGERSGKLAESLSKLADWGERDGKLRQKVKAAFTYPCIVFVVASLLTVTLFLTVIPGFVEMFEEKGMELPILTQIVVSLTHFITHPGSWVLTLGISTLLYLSIRDYYKKPHGAQFIYSMLVGLPLVGDILIFSSTARYLGVLGTLLESGTDLLVSLRLAGKASGNPLLEADSDRMSAGISDGESLSTVMEMRPDLYLTTVRQMLTVGEESSNLAFMCFQLNSLLEEDVAYRVEALGAALEPMMLVFVSCMVGGIVLAIIMPLYGFLNQLGI